MVEQCHSYFDIEEKSDEKFLNNKRGIDLTGVIISLTVFLNFFRKTPTALDSAKLKNVNVCSPLPMPPLYH